MATKMTCPGCHSHTTAVWNATNEGDPCPHCGLSASAIMEIHEIRRSKADQEMKDLAERRAKEASQWRARALAAEWRLEQVAGTLAAEIPELVLDEDPIGIPSPESMLAGTDAVTGLEAW